MPATQASQVEILKSFEAIHTDDLYRVTPTLFRRDESGKRFVAADGTPMPKVGQTVKFSPDKVALPDFHDRVFGHERGVTWEGEGENLRPKSIGHLEMLALSMHDEGQKDDTILTLTRIDADTYQLQLQRGAGRRAAGMLLVLSGLVPDFQLRGKIEATLSSEDEDSIRSNMVSAVTENLLRANYSAIDKAYIFTQWLDGIGTHGLKWTQADIARATGITEASISQHRNLTQLIPELQRAIHEGKVAYNKALSGKWHKKTREEQLQIAYDLDAKSKGEHKAKESAAAMSVTDVRAWAQEVIDSTAHKEGSKEFCRMLLSVLTARTHTKEDLDDTLERVVKSRV